MEIAPPPPWSPLVHLQHLTQKSPGLWPEICNPNCGEENNHQGRFFVSFGWTSENGPLAGWLWLGPQTSNVCGVKEDTCGALSASLGGHQLTKPNSVS